MKLILFFIGLCVQLHAPIKPYPAADPVEIVIRWECHRGEGRARINALYDRIAYLIEEKRAYNEPDQGVTALKLVWAELNTLYLITSGPALERLRDLQKLQAPELKEEVTKLLKLLTLHFLPKSQLEQDDYIRAHIDLDEYQRRELAQHYELWPKFHAHLYLPNQDFNSLEVMWRDLKLPTWTRYDKLDKLVYEYAKTLNGYLFNYLDEKKIIEEIIEGEQIMQAGGRANAYDQEGPLNILTKWDCSRGKYGQKISNSFHELGCALEEGYFLEKKSSNDKDNRIACQNSSLIDLGCKWRDLKHLRRGSDVAAFGRLEALQKLHRAPNLKLQEEVTKQLKLLTIRFLCEGGQRKPFDYMRADVDLNEDERKNFVQYYELWFEFGACLIKPDDCKEKKDCRYGVTCGALRGMFHDLAKPSMRPSFDELDKLIYEYARTVDGYVVDYSVVYASVIPQAVADPAEIVVGWEDYRGERRARINALYDRIAYLIEEKQLGALRSACNELNTLRKDTDEGALARLKALEKLQDAPNPKLQKEVTKQLKLLAVRYLCEQGKEAPAAYLRADIDLNEHERREFARYYELWSEFGNHLVICPNFNSLEMMWQGLRPPQSPFDELDKLVYEYAKTLNGYFLNYSEKESELWIQTNQHLEMEGWIQTDQYFKAVNAQSQEDPVRILANWERGKSGYWQKISTVFGVSDRVIFPGDKDEQIACQDSFSDLKCKWLHLISARKQSDAEAFIRLKALQKLQRTPPKLQEEVAEQLKLLNIRFLCEKGHLKPADYMRVDVDLDESERRKFAHYYELRQEFEAFIASSEADWNEGRYGVTYKALKRMFDDLVRVTIESSYDELDRLVGEYAQTVDGYLVDFEQHFE
jgi:hypothetical protein